MDFDWSGSNEQYVVHLIGHIGLFVAAIGLPASGFLIGALAAPFGNI